MSLVKKAKTLAELAHEGQFYGPDEPYTVHLDAVASLLADDTLKAIAYLHDVVEDTTTNLRDIASSFGEFIADCVYLVTDEPGKNRKERKAATNAKLFKVKPSHYAALIVKTADRVANVEACVRKGNTELLKMYRKEQRAFREAVYREGICESLWARIETALA